MCCLVVSCHYCYHQLHVIINNNLEVFIIISQSHTTIGVLKRTVSQPIIALGQAIIRPGSNENGQQWFLKKINESTKHCTNVQHILFSKKNKTKRASNLKRYIVVPIYSPMRPMVMGQLRRSPRYKQVFVHFCL